ncbi:hypothetical protein BCV70DRAFT_200905 [Testicularia cyperi]|uniref:EamA domain-containing protein n=1 Tax=Testicularia cyperi TaxID=1882483 RepID=A0A317XMN2_9BASI|nr:hypothetical protein BCV70DRAFT_200905 [Testicularia cyperi]
MSANVFRDSYADGGDPIDNAAQPVRRRKSFFSSLPGGSKATCAFVLSLVAYTLQTEFAQYVQQSLGYRKPFLSLYLGHSGFTLLFPMHLLFLKWTTSRPISHWLHLISQNLRWQLETPAAALPGAGPDAVRRRLSSASGRGDYAIDPIADGNEGLASRRPPSFLEQKFGFNVLKLLGLLGILTIGITVPALSWYCAVPMTSMADITAIYNTFSVWALVFSVWFLGEKWQMRKAFSVILACLGVVIVAYGGAEHRKKPKPLDPVHGKPPGTEDPAVILATRALREAAKQLFGARNATSETVPTQAATAASGSSANPMLGDFLAFVGAVTMAAYEMAFKLIGTLPDESKQSEQYSAVPSGRTRRSRSYIRVEDASLQSHGDYEAEGLLQAPYDEASASHRSEVDHPQHVLGFEDGEGALRDASEATNGGNKDEIRLPSSQIDRLIKQDRTDYHSITPPPERASIAQEAGDSDGDKDKADAKSLSNGVRVQAMPVSLRVQHSSDDEDEASEDQVTESELEDGEEDLVRSGATRLHRTRSQLSNLRKSSAEEYVGIGQTDEYDAPRTRTSSSGLPRPGPSRRTSSYRKHHDARIPPPLPFGLHANIMTAGIGLVTLSTFWIGLLVANALGWEELEMPPNLWTWFSIMMVVVCGIFFNGAFMILLSLWGPVLASVSCLMTTILVEIADVLLGHPLKWVSVLGCTLIGAGFAVLVGGDSSSDH